MGNVLQVLVNQLGIGLILLDTVQLLEKPALLVNPLGPLLEQSVLDVLVSIIVLFIVQDNPLDLLLEVLYLRDHVLFQFGLKLIHVLHNLLQLV